MRFNQIIKTLSILTALFVLVAISAMAAEKLPAEKAGTIEAPTGKIAFIRERNIWSMDADGTNQTMICQADNAEGRVSWSPDGKKILFTRRGMVDVKGPDFMGGSHRVNDLFIAYIDSAYANKVAFWNRLTFEMGSRDAEWGADGKITFWKDLNANFVNTVVPNYQPLVMDGDGSNQELLRKDWQFMDSLFLIMPSRNSDGKIAAVAFFDTKPQGMVILNPDQYMMDLDSIKAMAMTNSKMVSPAFSPDGKWVVYINNSVNDNGIYIATTDLKERYLVFSPPVSTDLYTYVPCFSPDSKWITFSSTDGSIWICDITGNGARRLTGPGIDRAPAWSKQ